MSTTDATRRRAFTAVRAVVALNALIDRGDRRRALLLMAFGFVATLFDVVALLLIVPLVTTLSTGTLPWYLAGPDAVITLPQWAADHPVVEQRLRRLLPLFHLEGGPQRGAAAPPP